MTSKCGSYELWIRKVIDLNVSLYSSEEKNVLVVNHYAEVNRI